MDESIQTLIQQSKLQCDPNSLVKRALDVLYEQWIVIPLQRAWRGKDHDALRQKYICSNCKKLIQYDINKHRCWVCRYIEKHTMDESARLDTFVY